MAHSVTHKFTSGKADGGDTSLIRPSNWNDTHNITVDLSDTANLSNTLPNSKLTNSSITIGSTGIALGDTVTSISGLTLSSPTINGTIATTGLTVPAITLGGTVSGGGNQLNNVIIGTTTPLAGYFTSISASSASSFATGVVGAPSIYLSTDTTSGLYRIGANNIGFSISGAKVLDIASTGMSVTGVITASGGVDKLTTASGVVSVAAATAPSTGQVLMATSATTATWQTPTAVPLFSTSSTTSGLVPGSNGGGAGVYLNGNGGWSTVSAGATLSSVAASTTYYLGMTSASSGAWTDARVATSDLIYTSGDQTLYATNFNTASDARLKTNVINITDALDTVNKMQGVGFNWLHSGNKSYGVIAQSLKEVVPELVKDEEDKMSVNYNAIIGFLIEAVKELTDKVSKLENTK